MQLTLVALLTGILVLPGIFATWGFFRAGRTAEVDLPLPILNSATGIALVGGFSLATHLCMSTIIWLISVSPGWTAIELLNPYAVFVPSNFSDAAYSEIAGLFAGLIITCLFGLAIGRLAGAVVMERGRTDLFYGPLHEVLRQGVGHERFIVAFVLTKIADGGHVIGYQGPVDAIVLNRNQLPSSILFRSAVLFKLNTYTGKRTLLQKDISALSICEEDWENIAFKVVAKTSEEG